MSIYSHASSGVNHTKTFFKLKEQVTADIPIGKVVPLYADFAMPGDIWHLRQNIFIRTQPMLAPLLTALNAKVRAWFVPLRLLDDNTELIITGSKNGKFDKDLVIPSFKKMFDDATDFNVDKYSILDYMLSLPVGNYQNIKDEDSQAAQYWLKSVARVWFDWYRDENLSEFVDFEEFWDTWKTKPGKITPFFANWKKDYFTSALPFQQKGIRPSFDFAAINPLTGTSIFPVTDFTATINQSSPNTRFPSGATGNLELHDSKLSLYNGHGNYYDATTPHTHTIDTVSGSVDLSSVGGSFTTTDLRLMTQLQRVMERLARCGSRYTEYLQANFGVSPADETLQRAQYLGGYTQPIITQEVLQSSTGDTPTGTLRGKGISLSENKMPSFLVKEFGVIVVTVEVMPKANYTQGIRRKYSYKNRYDFPNPSFQNLSEQEIRNGELFIDFSLDADHKNDKTWGFTEMYNELRSGQDRLAGSMRDTLSYWTLARYFSDRPVLSEKFVQAQDDFSGPFAVTDQPPLIVEMGNINGVYRNLQKFGTPGFVDHN